MELTHEVNPDWLFAGTVGGGACILGGLQKDIPCVAAAASVMHKDSAS